MTFIKKALMVALIFIINININAQTNIVTLKSLFVNGDNVKSITEYEASVEDKFNNLVVGPRKQMKTTLFDRLGNAVLFEDSMRKILYTFENERLIELKTEFSEPLLASRSNIEKYDYLEDAIKITLYNLNNILIGLKVMTLNQDGTYKEEKRYDSNGDMANMVKYEYFDNKLISYKNYNANGSVSMSVVNDYDKFGNKIKVIQESTYLKLITYFEYYENGLPKNRTSVTSDKTELVEYEYDFNEKMNVIEKREYIVEEKFGQILQILSKIHSMEYSYYD